MAIDVDLNDIMRSGHRFIIQLLTIKALDIIGILRSISHHVQCLNSQQLFFL